jgi:hypothetical protein
MGSGSFRPLTPRRDADRHDVTVARSVLSGVGDPSAKRARRGIAQIP